MGGVFTVDESREAGQINQINRVCMLEMQEVEWDGTVHWVSTECVQEMRKRTWIARKESG